INARVKTMIDAGLVDEAASLLSRTAESASTEPLPLGRQAREALGYKQIFAHLNGESTLEDAIEEIKIRTRRFAKQQRNWLKRFRTHKDSLWINVETGSAEEWQNIVEKTLTSILVRLENPV
ncbi:MAG TPA: tRNA dimethylallyltransferase, partial [Phycisphaerales bacterium]|nr:tRNA dimethylallyltransferase [Phycisphaerales bacterium]